MKLDWDTRIDIYDQNIILHKNNSVAAPRVTIGLPTYRRGLVIRRALESIASQTYRNYVVIVSDNNGIDAETIAAVEDYTHIMPEIFLIAQDTNSGALNNLRFLLAAAATEYFMWLADDDEISPGYIEELVGLLDANPLTVTAVGRWMALSSPTKGVIQTQLRLDEESRLSRLFRFVACNINDSAFYGLHRISCLRTILFSGYFFPNSSILTNWCYLLLYDMLLQGRFSYSEKVTWICHNYSEKEYDRALARGVADRIKTLLRRLNVYALYIGKTARKVPILVPFIVLASSFSFIRDVAYFAFRSTRRVVMSRVSSI